MPDGIDVTVILNAHREGLLAHRSLASIRRAVAAAEAQGVRCEVLAVLDAADDATRACLADAPGVRRIAHVAFGDLAAARNHGVSLAEGQYVAFVDADDLVSANWLAESYGFAAAFGSRTPWVLHPALNVYFGERRYVYPHVDQESAEFRRGNLFEYNYWTALAFVRTSDAAAMPYRSPREVPGAGYEDWDWNCRTIAAGWLHKVVPGTAHFIRRRGPSMSAGFAAGHALVRPSEYFADLAARPSGAGASQAPVPAPAKRGMLSCAARAMARWAAAPGGDAERAVDLLGESWRALRGLRPPRAPPRARFEPALLAEWAALAELDPSLRGDLNARDQYFVHVTPISMLVQPFAMLMSRWQGGGHARLATHRTTQHALDEEMLEVAPALPGERGSGPAPDPIALSALGALTPVQRAYLLARSILQAPPAALHVAVASPSARALLARHGAAVCSACPVVVEVAGADIDAAGDRLRFLADTLPGLADRLAGIEPQDERTTGWLAGTLGLSVDAQEAGVMRAARCSPEFSKGRERDAA